MTARAGKWSLYMKSLILTIVVAAALTGCSHDDAEQARQKLQQAGEQLKHDADVAAKTIKEEADKASQEIRKQVDEAKHDANSHKDTNKDTK